MMLSRGTLEAPATTWKERWSGRDWTADTGIFSSTAGLVGPTLIDVMASLETAQLFLLDYGNDL